MKTIWKYEIVLGEFILSMPTGAHILSMAVQAGRVCMWALVNPDAPTVPRRFNCVGTGHPIDADELGSFVGTCMLAGGGLVFHLFDLGDGQLQTN